MLSNFVDRNLLSRPPQSIKLFVFIRHVPRVTAQLQPQWCGTVRAETRLEIALFIGYFCSFLSSAPLTPPAFLVLVLGTRYSQYLFWPFCLYMILVDRYWLVIIKDLYLINILVASEQKRLWSPVSRLGSTFQLLAAMFSLQHKTSQTLSKCLIACVEVSQLNNPNHFYITQYYEKEQTE